MTPTEQGAQLLHDRGHGTYVPDATGGSIFLGSLPDQPELAIAVAPYQGPPASVKQGYDDTRMQLRIRGTRDYRTGAALAQDIYDDLHGLAEDLSGGTPMLLAECLGSGPTYIGPDSTGRHQFTINVRMVLRRLTAHRT